MLILRGFFAANPLATYQPSRQPVGAQSKISAPLSTPMASLSRIDSYKVMLLMLSTIVKSREILPTTDPGERDSQVLDILTS